MIPQEILDKRDKFGNLIKVVTGAVAVLLVAPLLFFVLQGLATIVALGVAGAVGFTMIQLAPWFSLKVANWKYRLIEHEKTEHIKNVTNHAAENPIETLVNLLQQKKLAFKEFELNVTKAVAARDTFKAKVEKFSKNYPHRAAEFQRQLERMFDLVDRKKKALADAQQSLKNGELKLEEMTAYWEMSKDAIAANRAAGMDTGDAFEKLKADTACDAVFDSMNAAFAQLEVAAALDENSLDKDDAPVAQLTHSEPNTIEVPVRETAKVRK